jgi:hypothetical protein
VSARPANTTAASTAGTTLGQKLARSERVLGRRDGEIHQTSRSASTHVAYSAPSCDRVRNANAIAASIANCRPVLGRSRARAMARIAQAAVK